MYQPECALIDADIVLHRVGFTTENDEFWVAKARCDDMLDKILVDTGAEFFQLWLSDSPANNFRYSIYPAYKANRTIPKPKHHEHLKAYIIQEWGARFAEGMEADDYLGILQDSENSTTVICSIDKDLKQIPGIHYNFVKEEWDTVNEDRAIKEFYKQLLIGDVSDNIPGARGVGRVKAGRAVDPIISNNNLDSRCARVVHDIYYKSLIKEWDKKWSKEKEHALWGMILLSGRLLKIKRSFKEPLWGSQLSSLMEEYLSSYTLQMEEVIDPYTELTTQERKQDGSLSLGILTEDTSQAENLVT